MQELIDLRDKWTSYLQEAEQSGSPTSVIQMINWFISDLNELIGE